MERVDRILRAACTLFDRHKRLKLANDISVAVTLAFVNHSSTIDVLPMMLLLLLLSLILLLLSVLLVFLK